MIKCGEEVESGQIMVDAENREIYFFKPVESDSAQDTIISLRSLDRISSQPITLIINSGGGSVQDGFAIYDQICACKSKVIGVVFGACYSMAALILQGCDTRVMAPTSRFMIHDGAMNMEGRITKTDFKRTNREVEALDSIYNHIMADRAGVDVGTIEELCKQETYLDAEQTVEYGWADYVLGNKEKHKVVKRKK
jgi:ATP-dependent Clp protease protease subunit